MTGLATHPLVQAQNEILRTILNSRSAISATKPSKTESPRIKAENQDVEEPVKAAGHHKPQGKGSPYHRCTNYLTSGSPYHIAHKHKPEPAVTIGTKTENRRQRYALRGSSHVDYTEPSLKKKLRQEYDDPLIIKPDDWEVHRLIKKEPLPHHDNKENVPPKSSI